MQQASKSCELAGADSADTRTNPGGAEPVISVCIANYNGMGVIDECLRSVLEQQGEIAVEILVHDDASSDGSLAHIRDHYPTATVIASESNVGFCVANNRMSAQARGKYLLLLNNDATLYPDALLRLLCEAERLDRPAILGLPQYDASSGELIDVGSLFDPFLNPVPNLDRGCNDVGMIIGACLWLPRTLWNDLGGFPEWFQSLAEDMYLCCRARLAGHPVRAIGQSGFLHRVGHSLGGGKVTTEGRLVTSRRRRALSERNKTFVMIVSYPAVILIMALPLHIMVLLMEGLLLSMLKRDATLWQTIYAPLLLSLWNKRGPLLKLRRETQEQRRIHLGEWLRVFRLLP